MTKSIQELLKDATELKDIASFNAFLNQTPPQVWLKPKPTCFWSNVPAN